MVKIMNSLGKSTFHQYFYHIVQYFHYTAADLEIGYNTYFIFDFDFSPAHPDICTKKLATAAEDLASLIFGSILIYACTVFYQGGDFLIPSVSEGGTAGATAFAKPFGDISVFEGIGEASILCPVTP
jgi:hypothetical protein